MFTEGSPGADIASMLWRFILPHKKKWKKSIILSAPFSQKNILVQSIDFARKCILICFDLHCDTLFRMHREGLPFNSPLLHLNRGACEGECARIQAFALWSDRKLSENDAWEECIQLLHVYRGFCFLPRNTVGIFTVEDARLLRGDLKRLAVLRSLGVRALTFFWRDENELGGGWHTEIGLSRFGKQVLTECFRLGIIPDVSHASFASAEEIIHEAMRCGKTVIASHGGAYAV